MPSLAVKPACLRTPLPTAAWVGLKLHSNDCSMELTVLAIEPGVVHSMARLVVLRQPNAFITPTSLSMLNGLNFHVAAEGGGE